MVQEVLIVRPSACEPRRARDADARHVAQRIGAYLLASNRLPDGIVAAPDARSRRLAEETVRVLGLPTASVANAPRVRRQRGAALVAALQVLEGERLLAFSEVPGLDLPEAPLLTLAHVQAKKPRVQEAVSREELPITFPFPTPRGVEQRPCPAYYYFQSGVIPYRRQKTGLEVLLIRNNKRTRWGIPKGIHEPGYSAQASAAREAFEEAGVLGDVGASVVGTYSLKKWGGTCSVTVFPMLVTCVLPKSDWQESHRGRRWVSASDAPERVRKKALARILAEFATSQT